MSERLKIQRGSGNVFRDVGFAPEEAENMLLRAQLMSEIREVARGMTQAPTPQLKKSFFVISSTDSRHWPPN
jgi:predicted XRE-type DNA-binding protein